MCYNALRRPPKSSKSISLGFPMILLKIFFVSRFHKLPKACLAMPCNAAVPGNKLLAMSCNVLRELKASSILSSESKGVPTYSEAFHCNVLQCPCTVLRCLVMLQCLAMLWNSLQYPAKALEYPYYFLEVPNDFQHILRDSFKTPIGF